MFGKKKNKEKKQALTQKKENEIIDFSDNQIKEPKALYKGMRSLKDLFAPPSFDRGCEDYIKVGNKFVRSFVINGYPSNIGVGWLDSLYNYDGDMDTSVYIEPADDRTALEELTNKITQFESQLQIESEKGNIRNLSKLRNSISSLYQEREKLEQNYENFYYVEIFSNMYSSSKENLEKETQKLLSRLKGRKIDLMPCYLRQDDGYKSALPFGKPYIIDKFRNFNSGALTACFPFYNNEIYHPNGVYCGINAYTKTPVFIDFYDRNLLSNSNVTVFGKAGSGKTYFVSLLTMRSALKNIRTVIIDPEGEYEKLTKALNGAHIYIAPNSEHFINPFDIEEEDILDSNDMPTGEYEVRIKDKVADLLNLIGVMAEGLTSEQKSKVSFIIAQVYKEFGFTEDPKSLYVSDPYFDKKTKIFYHDGVKKKMPRFSDFHNKLRDVAEKENISDLKKLANALEIYKEGGVYDLFDCYTSKELENFKDAPIVTFNIKSLEENSLRPIGMYIALSWAWEKFAKKNIEIRKRIVCDEAWMLVCKNFAGYEYTSQFLETCSRRIRKRNGGLLVASQNFIEFANNEQGKAVLTNAMVNMFLRQDATDIDSLQDTFKLSDGERNFLLNANRGETLIKMNGESTVSRVTPLNGEDILISKKV